ncbi:hypothetical protein PENTCL1PPCAC_29417, partial [Pristionchus entomophagus]
GNQMESREPANGGASTSGAPSSTDINNFDDPPCEADVFDCVQITPEHIRSNGTVHTTPYAGIAELVDNAIDSGATSVRILYKGQPPNKTCGNYLVVVDNGQGMNRSEALNTIMIGYSTKKGNSDSIGQFGNGLKSGSMRLGETLVVCTKKHNEFTILMISLKYLDTINNHKCYVPCLSYELIGCIWQPMHLTTESDEKHEKALQIILQYSPFATERELQDHILSAMDGSSGTSIIITHLKRLENRKYEMIPSKNDLVIRSRPAIEEPEKKKGRYKSLEEDPYEVEDLFLSEYLSELYLKPKLALYIENRKVNVKDPIRQYLEPRWAYLAKGGLEMFLEREKQSLETEILRKQMILEEKTRKAERIMNQIHGSRHGVAELKALNRDHRLAQDEVTEIKNAIVQLTQKKSEKFKPKEKEKAPGASIRVHMGIDVLNRGNPRVIFYTNGRRIQTLPLNKKSSNAFRKVMGVVCVIDIPSTLLPTAQNREGYETPSEVNFLLNKIQRLAQTYFEYADSKFKNDSFWGQFGYSTNGYAEDCCGTEAERNLYALIGLRRQCAKCLEFRTTDAAPDYLAWCSLDIKDEPFECDASHNVAGCPPKSKKELDAENIKELSLKGKATYYGESQQVSSSKKPAAKPIERELSPRRVLSPAASRISRVSSNSSNASHRNGSGAHPRVVVSKDSTASSSEDDSSPPPPARSQRSRTTATPVSYVTSHRSPHKKNERPPPVKQKRKSTTTPLVPPPQDDSDKSDERNGHYPLFRAIPKEENEQPAIRHKVEEEEANEQVAWAELAASNSTAARLTVASPVMDEFGPVSPHSSRSATRAYTRPTSVNERERVANRGAKQPERGQTAADERMNARTNVLRNHGYDTEQLINSIVICEELSFRRDNALRAFAKLLAEADESEKKKLHDEFCSIHREDRPPTVVLADLLKKRGAFDQV